MKNKFSVVILILYSLLLMIFAFNTEYINNVNLSIVNMLSVNNPIVILNIIKYLELAIFYIGYGISLTLVCIEYISTFKYIVIYSTLFSILSVIIVLLIKSFYIRIDFYNFIISLFCVILGVIMEILVKIKQIRGGKYEK